MVFKNCWNLRTFSQELFTIHHIEQSSSKHRSQPLAKCSSHRNDNWLNDDKFVHMISAGILWADINLSVILTIKHDLQATKILQPRIRNIIIFFLNGKNEKWYFIHETCKKKH